MVSASIDVCLDEPVPSDLEDWSVRSNPPAAGNSKDGSAEGQNEHLDHDQLQMQVTMLADFLARLQLTRPEVLRVTKARNALWRFGKVLREGSTGRNLYGHSRMASSIFQFWSHSWHGPVLSKILMLLVVCNGLPAVLLGTVASVATRILISPYVGPLPLDRERGLWCMLAGVVVSTLTLLCWQSARRVFLDRICIHQTDPRLKVEGMLNLAALLKHSRSILVCWDSTYLRRMWCCVELAAFLKCHPDGQLIFRPVGWGPCAVAVFLSFATFLVTPNLLVDNLPSSVWQDQDWLFALAGGLMYAFSVGLFMYFTSAAARAHFRAVSAVQKQLSTFSFNGDTFCHCCSVNHVNRKTGEPMMCDREAMELCLEHWFGSVAAFDEMMQRKVSEAFDRKVSQCILPYTWLIGATAPMLWWAVHSIFRYWHNSWLAFTNFYYLIGWWLGNIPVLALLWLRIARRVQRRRDRRWKEVMLNIACSCLAGLMFAFVRAVETSSAFLMGIYGIVVVVSLSLLLDAFVLICWAPKIGIGRAV